MPVGTRVCAHTHTHSDAMTLRSQGIGNNDRLTLIVAKGAVVAPVASGQSSALTMNDALRTELLAHLRPHFTHDSCTMIIHKLDQVWIIIRANWTNTIGTHLQIMDRYVHGISLDDIDALAGKRIARAAVSP